jgi:hypothetical protein
MFLESGRFVVTLFFVFGLTGSGLRPRTKRAKLKAVLCPQLVMIRPLGKNYTAEAWAHCMKVWSVVVQKELKGLPECLLVCNWW